MSFRCVVVGGVCRCGRCGRCLCRLLGGCKQIVKHYKPPQQTPNDVKKPPKTFYMLFVFRCVVYVSCLCYYMFANYTHNPPPINPLKETLKGVVWGVANQTQRNEKNKKQQHKPTPTTNETKPPNNYTPPTSKQNTPTFLRYFGGCVVLCVVSLMSFFHVYFFLCFTYVTCVVFHCVDVLSFACVSLFVCVCVTCFSWVWCVCFIMCFKTNETST